MQKSRELKCALMSDGVHQLFMFMTKLQCIELICLYNKKTVDRIVYDIPFHVE